MSAVNLASSARTGLTTLRNIADQMEATQTRLATGKAVNTPIDNAAAFFTAAKMDSRAASIDSLNENFTNAQTSMKAASEGIKGLQGLIKEARGLATKALSSSATERTALMGQFNTLQGEITKFVADADINGDNLLNGANITLALNEKGTSTTTITGTTIGAGLFAAGADWGTAADDAAQVAAITTSLTALTTASGTLETAATTFSTSQALVNTRKEFNASLSNILKSGSNDLTAADMDAEAANLMALQTRQQMAATALSIMQSTETTALRLLR